MENNYGGTVLIPSIFATPQKDGIVETRTGYYITSSTGRNVYLNDVRSDDIDIADIANGLSKVCRWSGQLPGDIWYSIAQHSILSACVAPMHIKKEMFLHDASEAYICDMSRPMKKSLPEYKVFEDFFQIAIGQKFKINIVNLTDEMKEIDNKMLVTEAEQFYSNIGDRIDVTLELTSENWTSGVFPKYKWKKIDKWWREEIYPEPYKHFKIKPLGPKEIKEWFMETYSALFYNQMDEKKLTKIFYNMIEI